MPLPNNIDLTAHADFGRHSVITQITPEEFSSLMERTYDDDSMTNEEYDMIHAHESIFGRRRHINEKNAIFRKYGSDEEFYLKEVRWHCARCGKVIVPWVRSRELCPECESYLAGRIPWRPKYESSLGDRTMEVFSLR